MEREKNFQVKGWPLVLLLVAPWFVGLFVIVKATIEALS